MKRKVFLFKRRTGGDGFIDAIAEDDIRTITAKEGEEDLFCTVNGVFVNCALGNLLKHFDVVAFDPDLKQYEVKKKK